MSAVKGSSMTANLLSSSLQAGSEEYEKSSSSATKYPLLGVYAGQLIAKNSKSKEVSTVSLMSSGAEEKGLLYCTIDCEEMLECTESTSWMRRIKLSEDVHSYNILFELHCGNVCVRAVKDIPSGHELVAWFSEEVSILMSIPFLTPFNIQGNNRYTCHMCQMTFETPNPLKVHLALACGRHSMDTLFIRLHYATKTSFFTQQMPHHISPAIARGASPIPSQSAFTGNSVLRHRRVSAFKPISSTATGTRSASISVSSSMPTLTMSSPSETMQHSTSTFSAAAQIEAIVSNMGASKQGHLCIYCGKIYSRKYGLKIHIRTHTGFKPLKCKFCLRPFGDPSNLNKHVRLHLQTSTGNETAVYKCNMCSKSLARRRDLQRHIEARHPTA